jgi:drug/metabolite transporter (DMT)-like permease
MGHLGSQPEKSNTNSGDFKRVENALRLATQELENLHQGLITEMTQDVARLRAEKARLQGDIDELQVQYQRLRSQQFASLSEQQLAQQQLWAKQLAQALATHLQKLLTQRLEQLAVNLPTNGLGADASISNKHSENTYRLLASLDSTLNTAFKSLQQELNSYQSLLSQQLSQMYSLEQQGEAILESLVSRLREQLQNEAVRLQSEQRTVQTVPRPESYPAESPDSSHSPAPTNGITNGNGGVSQVVDRPRVSQTAHPTIVPVVPEPEPPAAIPKPVPKTRQLSQIQLGLILVLLSSLTLSFQNVVVRIILFKRSIFGLFDLGGFISLANPELGITPLFVISNSLLLLLMRMILVAPLMIIFAPRLYPGIWRDLKQLVSVKRNRPLLSRVVLSGFCLFLSQFLIYIALGNIPTGIATTIFFIYPAVTVLLSWWIFQERPTFFLTMSIITIYLGCFLAGTVGRVAVGANPTWGTIAAVLSGVAFAAYVILTQICAQKLKLHPIPFSFINFCTILLSSAVSLLIFPIGQNAAINWQGLWGGACVLALTTLVGYLLNNYGIPLIGGALASVIGASGPAFTVILAWIMIGEKLQGKEQIVGVLLVTLWVGAIGIEKMKRQPLPNK